MSKIESFHDRFNDVMEKIQPFLFFVRAKETQKECIELLKCLLSECKIEKNKAISDQAEDSANTFLAYEFIIKACIEELNLYINLKADNANLAWDHLVNAQLFAACAMKSHAVASHLDNYTNKLLALEKLLFPQQMFFSTGLIIKEAKCNICGLEYGDCDHIKDRPYMGRLCGIIINKTELLEVSIVSDPADKHCRAFHITQNGITKDALTLREIKKTSDSDN